MVTASHDADGLRISAAGYRLWFRPDRPYAVLEDANGDRWAELCTLASVGGGADQDDTTSLSPPAVAESGDGMEVRLAAGSSAWRKRSIVLVCRDDELAFRVEVQGAGRLSDVHLLGGHCSAFPRWGSGFLESAGGFRSLMCPDPAAPERPVGSAAEPAAIDVLGSSLPGRGRWFFTPGPLCFAASRAQPDGGSPWMSLGLAAPIEEMTFTALHYEPGERTFSLRLAYEGATVVDGSWASPWLLLRFGAASPYAALADYAARLRATGLAPQPTTTLASWWREPIFCGWGAQSHLAAEGGGPSAAAGWSRQSTYDRFLAELSSHGVEPGTIVIDDRWESAYGSGQPDPERWPDLRAWIADRHAQGRRVLLWWKAWATDALPPELCVRNAAGNPVAADPTNPATEALLEERIARLLAPDGLGADGLKVDFTALTPSGPGMQRHGAEWGMSLLHRLLKAVHDAAHGARADALVITHAPNPAFADVSDMIRLNDVQRLDDPSPDADLVEHMAHRAAIVGAVLPGVLIDTDNWAMPDLATWRRYLEVQPRLGVPSLYYTTHIDRSGEALADEDFARLRGSWQAYRAGLAG